LNRLSPLYVLWLGLSLAAVALFAEAVRGFASAPAPAPIPPPPPVVASRPGGDDPPPPRPDTEVPAPAAPGGVQRVPAPSAAALPPLPPLPAGEPPPRIQVDRDTVDFGTLLQGTEAPHAFVVRNAGRGILRIFEVVQSCGCMALMPEKRDIPPGGSGEVRIVFKAGNYVGPQHKTVAVRTNDPARPVTVLHVKSVVDPLFLFDPPALTLGELPRGVPVVREISIRETQGRPFAVGSVHATLAFLEPELLPDDGGAGATRRLRLTIRPDGAPGGFVGHVSLKVDRPGVTPTFVVQGIIAGEVGVFPQSLFLGMVRQDQAFPVQSLVLRARGDAPIAVKGIETSVPWLKAELKTVIPDKVFQVDLTVDPTPPPGRFEETVRIATSDPPPPYTVTVSGVVRKIH